MKIVYIAHPVGGDIEGNIKKILSIVREINLTEKSVIPFVPYLADIQAMKDDDPAERQRGFRNNKEFFDLEVMDELLLCGDRISDGMRQEVLWSLEMGTPIRCANQKLNIELNELILTL